MSANESPADRTVKSLVDTEQLVFGASKPLAAASLDLARATAGALAMYDAVAFLRSTYTLAVAAIVARFAGLEGAESEQAAGFADIEKALKIANQQLDEIEKRFAPSGEAG